MAISRREITFNEDKHSYTDNLGNVYTSVTTLIDKYKKPFDKMFWAKKKAIQRGISVNAILAEWNDITQTSITNGKGDHSIIDDSIKNANGYNKIVSKKLLTGFIYTIDHVLIEDNGYGAIEPSELYNSNLCVQFPDIYKIIIHLHNQGYKLYSEVCVYNSKYLICGTIDLLLIKDKEFIIIDWKTNTGEIPFIAGYFKKDSSGVKTKNFIRQSARMLTPLEHLDDCKGTTYTLQLSLYSFLCECFGLKCSNIILCHIRRDASDEGVNENRTVDFHKIKYLKKEVISMMKHHLKGVVRTNQIKMDFNKGKSKFAFSVSKS